MCSFSAKASIIGCAYWRFHHNDFTQKSDGISGKEDLQSMTKIQLVTSHFFILLKQSVAKKWNMTTLLKQFRRHLAKRKEKDIYV